MASPLNLSDLIDIVKMKKLGLPPDVVEAAVRRVFREIADGLADGRRVELRGFGMFDVRELEGGTGRNPKTGAAVELLARRRVHWRAGKRLANQLRDQVGMQG